MSSSVSKETKRERQDNQATNERNACIYTRRGARINHERNGEKKKKDTQRRKRGLTKRGAKETEEERRSWQRRSKVLFSVIRHSDMLPYWQNGAIIYTERWEYVKEVEKDGHSAKKTQDGSSGKGERKKVKAKKKRN